MRLPSWVGIGDKTLWDVLQLLIVPVMLAGIAIFFNASQASRDQKHEDRRIAEDRRLAESAREDATLETYLGNISKLILDRDLLDSKQESAVQAVARSETLSVLHRVNGSRKGEIVRFLFESGLLNLRRYSAHEYGPTVRLDGADLRNVDLRGARLAGGWRKDQHAILNGDMRGAKLDGAYLSNVRFQTSLKGVTFNGGFVAGTDMSNLDLSGAQFKGTLVSGVNLRCSQLAGTTFDHAILDDVDFSGAALERSSFVGANFGDGNSFKGAIGRDVNLSGARNLSRVDGSNSSIVNARLDGKERPRGWGPTGSLHPGKVPEHTASSLNCV